MARERDGGGRKGEWRVDGLVVFQGVADERTTADDLANLDGVKLSVLRNDCMKRDNERRGRNSHLVPKHPKRNARNANTDDSNRIEADNKVEAEQRLVNSYAASYRHERLSKEIKEKRLANLSCNRFRPFLGFAPGGK